MNGEEKSSVEKLKEKLYSRTRYKKPTDQRSNIEQPEDRPQVAEKWDTPELDEMLQHDRRLPEPYPIMKKIFVFALLFFIGTLAITAFIFLGGSNFISSKNVDISVSGPASISAGDVLELGITISNKNNADLQVANLSIQYPQGSHEADNPEHAITYVREELGAIGSGDELNKIERVILFGEEGEVKQIKISVEYRISGSNATFYKDKIYEITIGEPPLTMIIDQPDSVNSGDAFNTNVTVSSASTEVLRNVVVKADYPPGYSLISSQPQPLTGENFWSLGDMPPGSEKTLTLKGHLLGENQEKRTFHFTVGVGDPGLSGIILGADLVSLSDTVSIARPSVSLSLALDGDESFEHNLKAGDFVSADIRVRNNLSDKIVGPKLVVHLSGTALDENSVSSSGGVYDRQNNTITWNLVNLFGQPEILPGADGEVNLRFRSLEDAGEPAGEINIEVSFSGRSVGEISREIGSELERLIKVSAETGFQPE